LRALAPDPREEWRQLLQFVQWGADDQRAALATVDVLFRGGPELVAATYRHLAGNPVTAAVLGWEERVDEAHLEERRRFFTVWLARTLGLDTSDEFALYLFRAGQYHAGHGPRQIHVPSAYVTTSMGLVLAAFADTLRHAQLDGQTVASAMSAWSKYLTLQLHVMLLGYGVARDLRTGTCSVRYQLYGRVRHLVGRTEILANAAPAASLAEVLGKLFNYSPVLRDEALEPIWEARTPDGSLWQEVLPVYAMRRGWRILLNGRDVEYEQGLSMLVSDGDTIAVFPPGR
jgi:molybdopterin converting factor small subunit